LCPDKCSCETNRFFAKHKAHLNEDAVAEIYGFLKHDLLKAAIGADKAGKAAAILPVSPEDLDLVVQAGGALKFSKPRVYRSPEWLSQYGLCIDNIRSGESTVPHAGRGAFATRSIAAGQLVAPAPLTHFSGKAVLEMHELFQSADGNYQRATDKVIGQQLLLNYCFSHPESSLLFFPTGALVPLINHSDEPNAKIIWSSHSNHQKMWLTMTPQELMEEENMNIGLLIEIVATRDIAEGEEIFIDYGPAWKAAYQAHVADWQAKLASGSISAAWPLRAADLNQEHRDAVFRTVEEQKVQPYPENVELRAFLIVEDSKKDGSIEQPKPWGETEDETAFRHENLFAVEVIAHDDATNTYTVKWVSEENENSYVEHVPHQAFVFVDKLGTGDQFAPAPFRHPIGFPDEIFPVDWRDEPQSSSAQQ
jgi:SET domain